MRTTVVIALVLFLLPASAVDAAAPAPGTWRPAASMHAQRAEHSAILLANGNVLVYGGAAPTAESYNPSSNTWSVVAAPDECRRNHTATLLTTGNVLIAGGLCGGSSANALLYVAASGAIVTTGDLRVPRSRHTATLLTDGRVLVAGGRDSNFNSIAAAELYDPSSGTFRSTGSLNTPRADHTATLLPNGRVLVTGGLNGGGSNPDVVLDSAEIFDPTLGTWSPAPSMHEPRSNHTATKLTNGKVLVAGSSAELFDASATTWTPTGAPLVRPVRAVLLPDGAVLATAPGHVAQRSSGALTVSSTGELYHPSSGTWGPTPNIPGGGDGTLTLQSNGLVLQTGGSVPIAAGLATETAALYAPTATDVLPPTWQATGAPLHARAGASATLLANGAVLIVGGTSDTSAELYDPATRSFHATGNLHIVRSLHTATLLSNGHVLVAGGRTTNAGLYSGSSPLTSAEEYDPTTGTWTLVGSMHAPRVLHSATLLPDGDVLVVGGFDNTANLDFCCTVASAEVFDPVTGTWHVAANPISGHSAHAAVLLPSGKVLVAGGFDNDPRGTHVPATEMYDAFTGAWSRVADPAASRNAAVAALLSDGRVLLAGFGDCFACHEEFTPPFPQVFDPAGGTWADTAGFGLTVGRMLVLPDGSVLSGLQQYDPLSGNWTPSGVGLPPSGGMPDVFGPATSLLPSGGAVTIGQIARQAFVLAPPTTRVSTSCRLSLAGMDASGHAFIRVSAQDVGHGVDSLAVVDSSNDTVVLPRMAAASRDPAVVQATKIDEAQRSTLTLKVTNAAGQSLTCDPVVAHLIRQRGEPLVEVFRDVPRAEHQIYMSNGSPGLDEIDVHANGRRFRLEHLDAGETRRIDLSSATASAATYTIRVRGRGRVGSSALIVVSN